MLSIFKQLAVKEDLELGFGDVTQTRDNQGVPTPKVYKKISSEVIPGKKADASEVTIQEVLDEKITTLVADTKFAKLAGDASQVFEVATPTTDAEATTKKFVDEAVAASYSQTQNNFALKTNVLLKNNTGIYSPTDQYNPATKLYVDQKVTQIGAGDMAKATYDKNDNGVVDDTEALGGISSDKAMLTRGTVIDCNVVTEVGIYHGTGVANAPVTGDIMLESFVDSSGIIHQRLVDKVNSHEYSRSKVSGNWAAWHWSVTDEEIVDNLTSVEAEKVLSAKQGKILNDKITLVKSVPVGTIVMYHGQLSTLDSDWKFCDGYNQTPDLRDMFISGAVDEGDIGSIGGTLTATMPAHTHSANHSHTGSTVSAGGHSHSASHNHSASASAIGNHTHAQYVTEHSGLGTATKGDYKGELNKGGQYPQGVNTGAAGSHSHTITVNTKSLTTSTGGAHVHSITVDSVSLSTGASGGQGDNRPPYYKLAYIMKVK